MRALARAAVRRSDSARRSRPRPHSSPTTVDGVRIECPVAFRLEANDVCGHELGTVCLGGPGDGGRRGRGSWTRSAGNTEQQRQADRVTQMYDANEWCVVPMINWWGHERGMVRTTALRVLAGAVIQQVGTVVGGPAPPALALPMSPQHRVRRAGRRDLPDARRRAAAKRSRLPGVPVRRARGHRHHGHRGPGTFGD
jgi:hypothetical protein